MTADNVPPTTARATTQSTKALTASKSTEAATPPSESILKKMTKLDISPETVSFTLNDDGSTPDAEHKSFSVTPHPSKGVALDREPLKLLEPSELAYEDADIPTSHSRNFSAELSSMEEGSTPHSLLGSSARQMSRFAPGSASPATPMPEAFEVYEAKVHDHGNPLFGADLTPLPPAGTSRATGVLGTNLGSNPKGTDNESQEHSREEDSIDFGNENETAAPGLQQQQEEV